MVPKSHRTKVQGIGDDSSYNRRNALQGRTSSIHIYITFVDELWRSNGGWQIVLIGLLISVGLGSVIGIIPQVATQRYAVDLYGYGKGEPVCTDYIGDNRPEACVRGALAAQNAASYCSMARNLISLLCNSIAGTYSDSHGRRGVQLFALFLLTLSPVALLAIQLNTAIHPTWYFIFDSTTGMVSFMSIAFAQLSDVMPAKYRAASFGMFMGSFFAGIAIGPRAAVVLNHVQASFFSFAVRASAFVFALVALPETLPESVATHNKTKICEAPAIEPGLHGLLDLILRPILEMKILIRNRTLVLVTMGTFLTKIVFSADVTLFFYYAENDLGLRDKDVALMFFAMGIAGFLMQAVFLKYLISLFGEHGLLMTSFFSGIAHNLIYGFARSRAVLSVGLCLSQLTATNGTLLSALVSRNVLVNEQGRVQGAFAALSALAEAIGPVCFNFVYKEWQLFGPGTMFVIAAALYGIATVIISLIPSVNDGDTIEESVERKSPDESTPLVSV